MKIVFTPDWFLSHDVSIEVFSFIILACFSILAFKAYKTSKKKSVFYLGLGFLLIALAELSTIFTKIVLYYDTDVTREIGSIVVTYQLVQTVDIFYYVGFFFHRFLTLLGLYVIYKIPYEKRLSVDFILTLYLIFVAAFLSNYLFYFYHLTALILILFIIRSYSKIYKKENNSNTLILISAFALLGISQIIFILSRVGTLYVTAQIIQLGSYIILLVLMLKILKNGSQTKPAGNNI